MTIDILKLPNVSTDKDDSWFQTQYAVAQEHLGLNSVEEAKQKTLLLVGNKVMTTVVEQALLKWPQWNFKFKFTRNLRTNNEPKYAQLVTNFVDISNDGIYIGTIQSSLRRTRGNWSGEDTVILSNRRIENVRERVKGYETKDVKAALRQIKNTFYAATSVEIVNEANREIANVLNTLHHTHKNKIRAIEADLREEAVAYAFSSKEAFANWCHATNSKTPSEVMGMLSNHDIETAHFESIADVQRAYAGKKTALVIKNQDGYILQVGDEVKLCNDSTVPENIKAKLGMLKLVESKQVVNGAGCRVNDETFLVLLSAD